MIKISIIIITYDASIDLGDEAKSDGNIEAARSAKRNKESLSKMLSSIQSKRDEDGTFLTSVASSRLSGSADQSSKITDGPMPFISPLAASITRIAKWSAHSDSILSMQLINDPPSLVTSGYDRLVRVWTQTGTSLGKLQRGHMNRSDWNFKADVQKFAQQKRDEASEIIERINQVVAEEEQKRKNGDFENANPFYDISDDENEGKIETAYKLDLGKVKNSRLDAEEQMDSVRLDVANLDETRARLISDYSNLSITERNNRAAAGRGLADILRRTPRLAPVGPQQAGKGLSATPRGRSSRLKSGSKGFKIGARRRQRK